MRTGFFIAMLFFIAQLANAQVIPANRQVLWSGAGIPSTNPVITNEVNVMSFGAIGDSIHNDAAAIISAIASLAGRAGIVYFPPGKYLIRSSISLPDSVILRGHCNDSTKLLFNLSGLNMHCIEVRATVTDTFQNVLAGFSKDTTVIKVGDPAAFSVGGYAEIVQSNGAWDAVPASWATNCVGQIVHITAISGNYITFENPLRFTYSPSLTPRIRKWTPRVFVGIEDMKIARIDSIAPTAGYMVSFNNAMNCWMKGVESSNSAAAHVSLDACTNITISGCYIHDAYAYDGGSTRGYGVMMIQHTGQCLIENNVFDHLRHAIIVKQGANGNVAGYNYAINGYRSEAPNDAGADLVCHGHYSFANLFEGNIVNNIMVDSTWGPTGPFTTFYRNRAASYGIIMPPGASVLSDSLNWVGNETTNSSLFHGLFLMAGANHYLYCNNILGTFTPAGTTTLVDTSYYRTSFSDIFNTAPYPPTVGYPNSPGSGAIPAMRRYTTGGRIATSSNPRCLITTQIPPVALPASVAIYPNPATDHIIVTGLPANTAGRYTINSMVGAKVAEGVLEDNNVPIDISKLPSGVYFLNITGSNNGKPIKFVVLAN